MRSTTIALVLTNRAMPTNLGRKPLFEATPLAHSLAQSLDWLRTRRLDGEAIEYDMNVLMSLGKV